MRGGLFEGALGGGTCEYASTRPSKQNDKPTFTNPKAEFKEVVIVGNGPSAICLSYILAGNWPYYGEAAHPISFLHHRLDANRSDSLLLQDLQFLCEGLEGRSKNPVAVLFDTLNHPDADLGIDSPSYLKWVHNSDHRIDHVVVGKGPPGGAWQRMEQSALTLSFDHWMELPNLNYREWEQDRIRDHSLNSAGKQSRALVSNVAHYYRDYVKIQQLENYFQSHCLVTSVERWKPGTELDLGPDVPVKENGELENERLWIVEGYCTWDQTTFCYVTPNVVLATGNYDKANRIHVPGEDLPYVLHSSTKLEEIIVEQRLGSHSDPILVIGAGLSSADAIITARFYGVPVAHAFRRDPDDPSLIFNQLPENMYPEYHKVHQMMKGSGAGYCGYRGYARHQVVEMLPGHKVRLEGQESSATLRVSIILVLIGSQSDLSFLKTDSGSKLWSDRSLSHTHLQVDAFTCESIHEKGLYALGPLVGDNFVRFLQGGALAVGNHLIQKGRKRRNNGGDACDSGRVQQPHRRHQCENDLGATVQHTVAERGDTGQLEWVRESWQNEDGKSNHEYNSESADEEREKDEAVNVEEWKFQIRRRQLQRRKLTL